MSRGWVSWMLVIAETLSSIDPARASGIREADFRTSDGVKLSYLEAGVGSPTVIFIPGWLMPAEIFEDNLASLSAGHRVIALSPRSQGRSDLSSGSHAAARRAQDIAELVAHVQPGPFVLVGWSLGVLESLDYLARYRPTDLAGMVLIDNSIGEATPPAPSRRKRDFRSPAEYEAWLDGFVRGMFRMPQDEAFLGMLRASAVRVPRSVADELLAKPYPREYYRDAIYAASVPVLYAITPRYAEQGAALASKLPVARISVYADAGHALFVDQRQRFDAELAAFLERMPRSTAPGDQQH